MPPILCQIFSSPRHDEMYLYVDRACGLEEVPEALLAHFGTPRSVMILPLEPQRRLARVETQTLIEALRDKGYYLQMPPGGDALSRDGAFSVEGGASLQSGTPGGAPESD